MRTPFSVLVFCFVVVVSCSKPKDMSLYYDNHLNDTTHLSNPEIKKQKEEFFKQVVKFDKWYRDNYQGIVKKMGDDYWKVKYYHDKEDTIRPRIIKDKVVPAIPKCKYISTKLKDKALKNSTIPHENLGFMFTGHEFGESLECLTFYQTPVDYSKFNWPRFLDSDRLKSEWDESPDRVISQKEALFYHLTMIKLINKSKAIYRVHTSMTNAPMPMNKYGYLILELAKTNHEWLIDDMYYITKDELIEDPRGMKGLIDYNNGYPGIEIP